MSGLITLTTDEHAALDRIEERRRQVRKGTVIQHSEERVTELFVLREGMMMSYVLLPDGSRQILRFYFPGEIMGMAGMGYRNAPETLCALADCVVCPFEKAAVSRLMVDHPRLGAMLMAFSQIERAVLTDRLASLGRTSARARVGALLLELHNRLRARDGRGNGTFPLGLTQEEIGDATGLTSVHVNRMLRQLEEDGLITREAGHVTIGDVAALARATHHVDRYAALDLSWLPPAR
ncbi:Crp/Fnr family transcriptional regulator [Sphingomonas japonica]|uniref:CRP-like cAMP-binding protein n=1 Tax=Sphingomonas japonica TaxID=511662 RepID=A0ABX0TZJ4_9SPHN|nr:Crp/Fnr family transcriptional regulator [Sphingomonas japonica]NIJ23260.1 CRP-like cAMP-binding protein [Sphingomonas japonica]